jgi:hypothetical protein
VSLEESAIFTAQSSLPAAVQLKKTNPLSVAKSFA